jgi:hypothetical protein
MVPENGWSIRKKLILSGETVRHRANWRKSYYDLRYFAMEVSLRLLYFIGGSNGNDQHIYNVAVEQETC